MIKRETYCSTCTALSSAPSTGPRQRPTCMRLSRRSMHRLGRGGHRCRCEGEDLCEWYHHESYLQSVGLQTKFLLLQSIACQWYDLLVASLMQSSTMVTVLTWDPLDMFPRGVTRKSCRVVGYICTTTGADRVTTCRM